MFWRSKRKRKKVGLALGGGSVRGAAHSEAPGADCLIVPAIGRFNWVDFSQVGALIEKGRQAAEAKIKQIKKDLELCVC